MSVNLMLGDCIDRMDDIEDRSVDMVLTDPPYGTTVCKWDSVIDIGPMWAQLKRIIKPGGAIVMTTCQPFTSMLVSSNYKMFKYDWVWHKPKGTGHLNAKKQPMRDKEDILFFFDEHCTYRDKNDVLVFYGEQCTYNPQMVPGKPFAAKGTGKRQQSAVTGKHGSFRNENTGTRYPKQVLSFGVVERGNVHPTQKPLDLMEYLIKTYTNLGETVLDFAMGSGTTGVACKTTGRAFIGIENDKRYFEIAKQRIREEGGATKETAEEVFKAFAK